MEPRIYLCIDLKSFYASVECVARGLDPFKTNLVVADPSRGRGAICLAITPAMKALGVRNRCRLFEIPAKMDYIIAKPRMRLYMQTSADIYALYLNHVSPQDIHVYSIDECFIDATPYLRLYHTTPVGFAKRLMQAVFDATGICATAGIGTNMFLAKVALDVTAKHAEDHIGVLDEETFRETVWFHRPITDIWNIGRGTAKRLAKLGVYDLHGIAALPEECLFREFGVNARFLIDHANGRESCTIAEIQSYRAKSMSFSNSQILFSDYTAADAFIVLREMVDAMTLRLVEAGMVTGTLSLSVGYSKDVVPPSGGSRTLEVHTDSYRKIMDVFTELYRRTTHMERPVRRLALAFGALKPKAAATFSLFDDLAAQQKEASLQQARIFIKNKYGKNALLRGVSYTDAGTARVRNTLIGGHNGE